MPHIMEINQYACFKYLFKNKKYCLISQMNIIWDKLVHHNRIISKRQSKLWIYNFIFISWDIGAIDVELATSANYYFKFQLESFYELKNSNQLVIFALDATTRIGHEWFMRFILIFGEKRWCSSNESILFIVSNDSNII